MPFLPNIFIFVRFEVLMAVLMKSQVFGDVNTLSVGSHGLLDCEYEGTNNPSRRW